MSVYDDVFIQCGVVIKQSCFFKILTMNTIELACEDQVWLVFCSASVDVVLYAVHVLDCVILTPDCKTRIFADDIFVTESGHPFRVV